MVYGENLYDFFKRLAFHVDRIFKGADPGELPIQQPTSLLPHYQPEDRERPRPDDFAEPPRPRRRGDRMNHLHLPALAAVPSSTNY